MHLHVQHRYSATCVVEAAQGLCIYMLQHNYSTPVVEAPERSYIYMVQHSYLFNLCCSDLALHLYIYTVQHSYSTPSVEAQQRLIVHLQLLIQLSLLTRCNRTFTWYNISIYSTPIADTPQGSYIYIVQHNYYPTSVAEAPQKSYIYTVQHKYLFSPYC